MSTIVIILMQTRGSSEVTLLSDVCRGQLLQGGQFKMTWKGGKFSEKDVSQ